MNSKRRIIIYAAAAWLWLAFPVFARVNFTGYADFRINPQDRTESILASAKRASELSSQLLILSQGKPIHKQALDLNEKIHVLFKTLELSLGKGIEIRYERPGQPLFIAADPALLEQVLLNLSLNSKEAMKGRGVLTIRTGRAQFSDPKPHQVPPGRYVFLEVSDTGVGFGPEIGRHLFEPFFTTKPAGKGRGLGLSITYSIVRQHNGHILFKSSPGQGAAFTLYFPDLGPLSSEQLENGKAASELPRGNETLLIAEDEPVSSMIMERLLRNQGYEVLMASDGDEAVKVFKENKDRVSLAVLDIVMPGLDGLEVYQKIAGVKPGTKALFVSAYATMPGAEEIGRLNLPFIEKPFVPEVFLRRVRRLLDS